MDLLLVPLKEIGTEPRILEDMVVTLKPVGCFQLRGVVASVHASYRGTFGGNRAM